MRWTLLVGEKMFESFKGLSLLTTRWLLFHWDSGLPILVKVQAVLQPGEKKHGTLK